MWVLPDTEKITPGYEQLDIGPTLDSGELVVVATKSLLLGPNGVARLSRLPRCVKASEANWCTGVWQPN